MVQIFLWLYYKQKGLWWKYIEILKMRQVSVQRIWNVHSMERGECTHMHGVHHQPSCTVHKQGVYIDLSQNIEQKRNKNGAERRMEKMPLGVSSKGWLKQSFLEPITWLWLQSIMKHMTKKRWKNGISFWQIYICIYVLYEFG